MFSTPEFWVLIAFILLFAAFGKRVYVFVTQTLDQHSQQIADQLAKAESLQAEALSLLNSYKKKHEEAVEQAAKIISFAELEVQEYRKTSEREIEKFMAQKEKALIERIALEGEEAKLKLRKQATDEALKIVEQVLQTSPAERKKITKASLKKMIDLKPVVIASSRSERGNLS